MATNLEKNEEYGSAGLDVLNHYALWLAAQHECAKHHEINSDDYWANVRKLFIEMGGKRTTPVYEKPIGPGAIMHGDIKPDPETVFYYQRQLSNLPNAFDPVTGEINQKNDKAVMLYTCLQLAIEYAKYPIKWQYVERTANTDRSGQ